MKHSPPSLEEGPSTLPAITGHITYDHAFFALPQAVSPYKPGILSFSASLVSTTVGFPLDSIKTRMQIHKFDSALHCLRSTIHHEGVKGLFRGISAPLISTSCSRSLGVSIFTATKSYVAQLQFAIFGPTLVNRDNVKNWSEQDYQREQMINNIPVALVSGSIAGASVSCFACPFEFTKLFSQVSMLVGSDDHIGGKNVVPRNIFHVARQIVRQEGIRGLYSGFKFHFLRDGLSSGLFYGLYETVKLNFQAYAAKQENLPISRATADALSISLGGAFAGMFSWILVFPIDTIKSMAQRDIVSNILRERSGQDKLEVVKRKIQWPTKRMYRGLGPSLTRSVTTTMIFFSLFEYLMKHIV
ncbi:unnamed protein product [Kuraishia capsulata CBS 1993]|uniref:Mitochondrial carrier protein n=1 Tax=Kuraishia capsulata CBS 1993 TaxID=1382522 RepID=W6MLT6_9ASCO|nr:uncharacterized protein KUCA_T00003462001 [Kuraishia capsulata CBS 1993]CDK27484.1 unnamed protein product [Kuraishia capsulata CBS 1993]